MNKSKDDYFKFRVRNSTGIPVLESHVEQTFLHLT